MTMCELCGRTVAINECEIEGTVMKVCAECSRFGKIKGRSNVKIVVQESRRKETNEPEYVFLPGFGSRVKDGREKLGLKPEDFAKKINERESLLHQIEREHIKPNIALARKLEKVLNIKIVEEVKQEDTKQSSNVKRSGNDALTLGDFVKKR